MLRNNNKLPLDYSLCCMDVTVYHREGSDASAAGGRRSELSEWQRSADEEGVRADEAAGHRNRGSDQRYTGRKQC